MIRRFSITKTNGSANIMTARLLFLMTTAVLYLGTASGCAMLNKCPWWGASSPRPPVVLRQDASLDDVIDAVNNNNAKKRTFVANDARINIEGVPVSLNSNIAYEYPRKLRVQGGDPFIEGIRHRQQRRDFLVLGQTRPANVFRPARSI